MIEKLIEIQLSLVSEIKDISFRRYIYEKINWDNRLIGLTGARGIGKTTLLLQFYSNNFKDPQDCLYLSADNINVINTKLYNIAEEFFKLGGEVLLIDEVHKYPGWQIELKNIYDSFPKKRIIFSGSSTVNILKGKADLSRRVVFYNFKGLSFREYLMLYLGIELKTLDFEDLLKDHIELANEISSKIPVLKYFREYLKVGYYPFFKEGVDVFLHKLDNVVEKIFYEDIPTLFNVKPHTIYSLKKLLYLVATSQPFIPNISRISSQLGISKEYIYIYIDELEKAGIFLLLYPNIKGFGLLRKPQKIYLENTNLFYLIEEAKGFNVQKGSVRETFFVNQIMDFNNLYYTEGADFIDRKGRLYEIGGKSKRLDYSHNIFYVLDDLIVGFKNRIPLWLFGFLY